LNGQGSNEKPNKHTSCVAQEDARRGEIEPQESEQAAGERQRDYDDMGIVPEASDDRNGAYDDDAEDARQSVDAIQEVNCIYRAQEPKQRERHSEQPQLELVAEDRQILN
jgi:hypothetical protein